MEDQRSSTQKAGLDKKHQNSNAFQSLCITERDTRLKRLCALHQIEARRLILSHKTCLSECLPLKMRVTLQPNAPNNGIDSTLPQRFGFLPPPKTNKPSQQELIQSTQSFFLFH